MYQSRINDEKVYHIHLEDNVWYESNNALEVNIRRQGKGIYHTVINGRSYRIRVVNSDIRNPEFMVNGQLYRTEVKDKFDLLLKDLGMDDAMQSRATEVKSPMPGLVHEIHVKTGEEVTAGQTLLVLEAMKMENVIKAPADAVVKEIRTKAGDSVEKNAVMITFE